MHASYFGTGDSTIQDNGNSSRVSHTVTNSFWFKKIMAGCQRCMGNVWLPDKAVSRYGVGECFCVLEREWNDTWDRDKEDYFALH